MLWSRAAVLVSQAACGGVLQEFSAFNAARRYKSLGFVCTVFLPLTLRKLMILICSSVLADSSLQLAATAATAAAAEVVVVVVVVE